MPVARSTCERCGQHRITAAVTRPHPLGGDGAGSHNPQGAPSARGLTARHFVPALAGPDLLPRELRWALLSAG